MYYFSTTVSLLLFKLSELSELFELSEVSDVSSFFTSSLLLFSPSKTGSSTSWLI